MHGLGARTTRGLSQNGSDRPSLSLSLSLSLPLSLSFCKPPLPHTREQVEVMGTCLGKMRTQKVRRSSHDYQKGQLPCRTYQCNYIPSLSRLALLSEKRNMPLRKDRCGQATLVAKSSTCTASCAFLSSSSTLSISEMSSSEQSPIHSHNSVRASPALLRHMQHHPSCHLAWWSSKAQAALDDSA